MAPRFKANASGNTLAGRTRSEAHLALAREQVQKMNEQAAEEEKTASRRAAAKRRAARQRESRLEAALREVATAGGEERRPRQIYGSCLWYGSGSTCNEKRRGWHRAQLQRATTYRYNPRLIVNVEATTDAIDYRQVESALQRCQAELGTLPKQLVADGDYTNHRSVQAAAAAGVDFYGSWQDSWKPSEQDALGRSGRFISSAFPYDAARNVFLCPAGKSSLSK